MKEYTTRFLKSVAIFYIGFPLFYILISALFFDIPGSSLLRILLSPTYYILSMLAVMVGYGLWEVFRWSWYLLIGVNFLIAYHNAILVNEHGTTHHKFISYLASVAVLFILSLRVSREIRVPYFFPKIRWWESNPRFKLSVPVKLTRQESEEIYGDIMDLSMAGCFIKIRADLKQHESLKLHFVIFNIPVECHGVIVWRAQSGVTTPKGIGVKFLPLSRLQKRSLRQVSHRLKRIANFYRRSRYLLNQEEFLKRLSDLESEAPRSRMKRQKDMIG